MALTLLVLWGAVPQAAVSRELAGIRKQSAEELAKLRQKMAALGRKGEVGDCDAILKKLLDPDKAMGQGGAAEEYPGEEKFGTILDAWADAGTRLSAIYKDGLETLKDAKEREQAEMLAGWFATFPDIARAVRQLNRRRTFMKLSRVTCDWSGSIGGYLHGRYLQLNRNHPSAAGLGAHNENSKLPGYSPEGAEAGHGVLATGDPAGTMDKWLFSRFHKKPLVSPTLARVSFGGLPGGWWSCKTVPGMAEKPKTEIVTIPGDGDTEVPTAFGGELPDPFPKGVDSSGTCISVHFLGAQPAGLAWRLLDAEGNEVPVLTLDKTTFVAKDPLASGAKYKVELNALKGFKHTFSFTTK
jgi:hypothetical protein